MGLIVALYLGVVLSDFITSTLGRMMRFGLLKPLRKKLKLDTDIFVEDGDGDDDVFHDNTMIKEEYVEGLDYMLGSVSSS